MKPLTRTTKTAKVVKNKAHLFALLSASSDYSRGEILGKFVPALGAARGRRARSPEALIQSHCALEKSSETHFCHITRRLRGADAARSSLVTVLGLPRPIPTRTVAKPEPKPAPLGQDGGQKTPY